ncbi:MAG: A/G-specific adenine glycosylase [Putridiphycobacter sp.]|nr:A/G-specific adenine glycosylase [Putridiphycobacter sp.]
MNNFTGVLQEWYQKNKRDLPWRNTKQAYEIWLSEIILQQTQVVQGLSYYYKFIAAYPNVNVLASSSQEHVLKNWQGLGYYSRARNLHFAAKQIVESYGGVFPSTYTKIKALKGVGDYTAAAIASFAFNEPYAVVDGNVYRVLSRLFAIKTPINSTKGKKEFAELAQSIIDYKNPGSHNQAMMELGALICRPQKPQCEICPLQFNCEANKLETTADFPVKLNKVKIKKRYLNYVIISDGKHILVNQRKGKGIWQGLYDFPLIESKKEVNLVDCIDEITIKGATFDMALKHILTHQHLYVKFWIANVASFKGFEQYTVININDLEDLPLPQLIVRYIEQSSFFKR